MNSPNSSNDFELELTEAELEERDPEAHERWVQEGANQDDPEGAFADPDKPTREELQESEKRYQSRHTKPQDKCEGRMFDDAKFAFETFNKLFCYAMKENVVVQLSDCAMFKPETFASTQYVNWLYKQVNDGKTSYHSVAGEWLKRADRNQLFSMTYAPGQPCVYDGKLNRWRGLPFAPKEGDIAPWNELLDFLFKDGPAERRYFEQWLAYPLQHPGAKLMTAVCLHSHETGMGKNIMLEAVAHVYGVDTNAKNIEERDLYANFNSWQLDRQFIVGNEINGSRDKRKAIERLKVLITSETVSVNEKYLREFDLPNVMNFVFTSNNPDAFYLSDSDRRFWIWEVTGKPLDKEFYKNFRLWKNSDAGIAALYYHLLHVDCSGFDPGDRAPMTQAKEEMIEAGRSELEQWLYGFPGTILFKSSVDPFGLSSEKGQPVTLFTIEDLLKQWDSDEKKKDRNIGNALHNVGYQKANGGKQIKISGRQERIWVLAHGDEAKRLLALSPSQVAEEYAKQQSNRYFISTKETP